MLSTILNLSSQVIGGAIGVQLLSGEINSTAKLMQIIGESLQSIPWQPPSLPAELPLLRKGWHSSQILIINRPWLVRFNWTPDVAVVSARGPGNAGYRLFGA